MGLFGSGSIHNHDHALPLLPHVELLTQSLLDSCGTAQTGDIGLKACLPVSQGLKLLFGPVAAFVGLAFLLVYPPHPLHKRKEDNEEAHSEKTEGKQPYGIPPLLKFTHMVYSTIMANFLFHKRTTKVIKIVWGVFAVLIIISMVGFFSPGLFTS